MDIVSVGGGPAGLYFSILMARAFPDARIRVMERNRPDDTFGWGVVFSAETLSHFRDADAPSYDAILAGFRYWDDIETHYGDTCVRSTGHGFCGMSRKHLLQIFHARCRELGVELCFEQEVTSLSDVAGADLVLAADGLHSVLRTELEHIFKPSLDWRRCKFAWLGTTLPMDAFTFFFKQDQHGLYRIHAYPFEDGLGTFIVECLEETWKAAGHDQADEASTIAYFERLFADELQGHKLLGNNSIWRTFPTVTNATWHHDNVVLMGDAAHTAHFSIGSGTKLAMEDAIALVDAFKRHGTDDVPAVLAAYEDERWVDVAKLQKAAQTSLEWFERSERYIGQHPLQFSFNLMTRSKRITWDNLALRDPALVARVREWWWDTEQARYLEAGGQQWPERLALEPHEGDVDGGSGARAPVPLFAPLRLAELELPNRIVVSPMCQYSATDGVPDDWHLVHLGARATGGAGLVFAEATGVSAQGRITPGCAGIWNDAQRDGWKRIVDFVHHNSPAKLAMQLAHAGRKASCSRPWEGDSPLTGDAAWQTLGPSATPFDQGWHTPRAMTEHDMADVTDAFVAAARRALDAGFDLLELHMAHGYLLSSFLSPAANRRDDAYGGSLEKRMRFPLALFEAVRAAWPAERPLAVRLSASDWLEAEPGAGMTLADSIEVAGALAERGCDLIDVSSAGNTPASRPVTGRMYQVPFAEAIRAAVDVPVMAVGAIAGADQANTILAAGRADLCALARAHLEDPAIVLGASSSYRQYDQWWPRQYGPARPRPRRLGRR
ncbi:MAG: bifunctional salicylyl-CoA 5-hydroxylase/oxidoreductase [Planctomycetota bacterium]|nr:MAG: bifunctional salicylyl-CoA 5-hydroxylase/oxidoreductase [Planctomycetota bacterium]